MTKADYYMKENISNILANGYLDENPRPHYKDGTPAHTYSVNHVVRTYDLSKNEFPICTLRPIAIKTGIKEILAIYQNQSNRISEFERMGCGWWKDWELENGTIGRSYPYNIESHRLNEMKKDIIKIEQKVFDKKEAATEFILGNYNTVKNFTNEEIQELKFIWINMIMNCQNNQTFVDKKWNSFEQFLKDVRYIPQYFLAREDNFNDWVLSKDYYMSNCYSKDTCVFLRKDELKLLNDSLYREELSRNQVIELIKELRFDPYGRRHIMSFWNWSNIKKKALVECAFETIWNVRNKDGEKYLDMCLIQRSGDMLTASGAGGINESQYAALLLMISKATHYKPGIFTHFVANEQIYDRHLDAAKEMLERFDENKKENISITLNSNTDDFFQMSVNDFEIKNYEPIKPQLRLELGI